MDSTIEDSATTDSFELYFSEETTEKVLDEDEEYYSEEYLEESGTEEPRFRKDKNSANSFTST